MPKLLLDILFSIIDIACTGNFAVPTTPRVLVAADYSVFH